MSDHVYKIVELVGSSTTGTDDAIRNAIEKASITLRRIDWFQVLEARGHVADGVRECDDTVTEWARPRKADAARGY